MSNVFARNHQPTGREYYDLALQLRTRVYMFVMNEKNAAIPQKKEVNGAVPKVSAQ